MAEHSVRSRTPGTLLTIDVSQGDRVSKGKTLARLEIMKMEIAIESPVDGRVVALHVKPGDYIEDDGLLMTLYTP